MKTLLGLLLACYSVRTIAELTLEELPQISLDLDEFNRNDFGILGDFDAITPYSFKGESNFTSQSNITSQLIFSPSTDQYLALGEVDGTITKIMTIQDDTFLILGDYKQIGSANASSPSLYNISAASVEQLDPESLIQGTVEAALYDSSQNLIYMGGDLSFNDTNGVMVYNLTSRQLESTLFGGFGTGSIVNSILKVEDNILFAGNFDSLGISELLDEYSNQTNTTSDPEQLVSMKYATISSSDGADTGSILCPSSSNDEWRVDSATSASLDISLPYEVIPSKLRLYNSRDFESEISLFRLLTSPSNGIMNLTYVNPETQELEYCDAWCPLFNLTYLENHNHSALSSGDIAIGISSTYQDFGFANTITVEALTLQVLDSYGSSVGLSGLQLYQTSFSTYANNTLNEPTCDSSANYSNAVSEGSWSSSSGEYITLNADVVSGIPDDDVGVTFYPNISSSGQYTISLYTPGCTDDDTCDSRGITNVTVYDDNTNDLLETSLIYQTNEEEKYDVIFDGHLDSPVRVEMVLFSTVPGNLPQSITFVADKITVNLVSIDATESTNRSMSLNGLFEYSPENFTNFDISDANAKHPVGNTTLNQLGLFLTNHSSLQAELYGDALYIAGGFLSEYGSNLIRFNISGDDNNQIYGSADVISGGTNGNVTSIATIDNYLFISGLFNNTNNHTSIQSYDFSESQDVFDGFAIYNGSWYSLDSSGRSFITNITLKNNEFWVFNDSIWDYTSGKWFNGSSLLSFNASSAARSNKGLLFHGFIRQSNQISNKGTFINQSGLFSNITNVTLSQSTINTGLFVNDSLSIFGGEFNTSSGIQNLLFVQTNEASGLDVTWSEGSSVDILFSTDSSLFIGTKGGGSVDDTDFVGLAIYDLESQSFISNQPDPIEAASGDVSIKQLGLLNNTYVTVGGGFDSAGEVSCSGLCFYNINETKWESLIDSFSGTVNSFRFVNDTVLVAAGDITYNNSDTNLFQYDFNNTSTDQRQPNHFHQIESTPQRFILVDNSTSGRIVVSSENAISIYDGSSWNQVTDEFSNSTFNDIALLNLEEPNELNNESFFNKDSLLFVSGTLYLKDYGYSNVAYFNSTTWIPYLIATHGTSVSSANSFFMNKDISSMYTSASISFHSTGTNSSSPTSSSSPSSSSTGNVTMKNTKSHKIKRGFIVLVALALSVGTLALMGLIGAFFIMKSKKHGYQSLNPRVDETEMIETVPPKDLFKYV